MLKKFLSIILQNNPNTVIKTSEFVHSSKPIIIYNSTTYSYKEIVHRTRHFAKNLKKVLTPQKPIIAFKGSNSPAYIISRLATQLIGGTFLPLHTGFTQEETKQLCNQTHTSCLLTSPNGIDIEINKIPIDNFTTSLTQKLPNNIFSLNLSSGTTNFPPKITMHTEKSWMQSLYQFIEASQNEKNIRMICLVPFATAGSVTLFPIMLSGGTYIIPKDKSPEEIVKASIEHECTHIYFTPHYLIEFLNYIEKQKTKIPSLKRIIVGTEPLHPPTIKKALRLLNVPLTTGYGMVECLPPLSTITFYPYKNYSNLELRSVGKPNSKTKIKINNGKIWVKSPTLAVGYLNITSDNYFINGGFQTSDYGQIDQNGNLHILGRDIDKLTDTLFARDIEEKILEEIRQVNDTCIIKCDDDVYVFISSDSENRLEIEYKIKNLLNFLKVDAYIIFITKIPTKITGKVNRDKLKKKILEQKGKN